MRSPLTSSLLHRKALEALDSTGVWQRSYHQRLFHDHFMRACARVFWKTEPPGSFARDHQRILEAHGWDHLHQEVLVSTPRRFGKTISISMFSAALIYSCPDIKLSIYSTCKRISQMLLQNIQMFLRLIYDVLRTQRLKVSPRTPTTGLVVARLTRVCVVRRCASTARRSSCRARRGSRTCACAGASPARYLPHPSLPSPRKDFSCLPQSAQRKR